MRSRPMSFSDRQAFLQLLAQTSHAPFNAVYISDKESRLLESSRLRLASVGAPVSAIPGPASEALPEIIKKLDHSGLHLAFLDPYNLANLSFDLIEGLSKVRADILLHLSIADLRRNVACIPRKTILSLIYLRPVGVKLWALMSGSTAFGRK